MSRVVLWFFFACDAVGTLWCVRTLVCEVARQVAWRRDADRYADALPLLELPADFVLVPAPRRSERAGHGRPLRLVA